MFIIAHEMGQALKRDGFVHTWALLKRVLNKTMCWINMDINIYIYICVYMDGALFKRVLTKPIV